MPSDPPPLLARSSSTVTPRNVGAGAERPLRICQVVPYDLTERGGVKHHAVQLARTLRARGDEVTVIGPSGAPLDEPGFFGFPGVFNVRQNGSDNRLGLFVSPARVRAFFQRHRFDVVHVHEPLIPSLPYWAVWFSPASAHVATFHAFSERPNPVLGMLGRLFAKTLRSSFQLGTAVSQPSATYARQTWKDPLVIVPNGVPSERFVPRVGPRRPGPVRLLFVGRLGDERKGYRFLETAFKRLRARGVDLTLDVVGELGGASAPAPTPGLTYHGPVSIEALVERYQTCDLFVAPSTGQESFGIVLLEAMAAAAPVICSDIDGYRSTVTAAGATLVPARAVEALEHAIVELAAHPERWSAMGKANRERALLFDWEMIASQLRAFYLYALEKRRLPGDAWRLLQEAPGSWGQTARISGATTLDV